MNSRILGELSIVGYCLICKAILQKITKKLSYPEKEYVENLGPKIVHLYNIRNFGGDMPSVECKMARREADKLQREADQFLTESGVTQQRQLLLKELVMNTYLDWSSLGPLGPENIALKIRTDYKSGFLTVCRETISMCEELRNFVPILDNLIKYGEERVVSSAA